jgi:signal transduction histidine kinase
MMRYWRLLLPAYLFTWPVFLSTFAWALLVHFIDSVNNDSGNILKRIVIITALHLMIYGILYLAKNIYLDRIKPRFVPSLLLLTVGMAAIFRGYIMEIWLFNWDITSSLDVDLRMRTSFLNSTISISVAIIAAANTRRHHMTKAHLVNEAARLESVKANAQASIRSIENEAIAGIKKELLRHVDLMSGARPVEILAILRTMIDKVVQPLSRKLETEFEPWAPPKLNEAEVRVDWYRAFRTSLTPGSIQSGFVPFLMCLVATPTVLEHAEFLPAVLGLMFTLCVGFIVGKLLSKFVGKENDSFVAYLFVTLTTGLAMGVSTLPLTQDFDSPFGLLMLGIFFYPFTSSIISLLTGADQQLAKSSEALARTTEELEWNVARVRETQYLSQTALARNLHGTVQAKLASTYLEIEKLQSLNQTTEIKLESLVQGVRDSIIAISSTKDDSENFAEVIEKVRENWSAIAEISVAFPNDQLSHLQRDSLCMATLVDVIPELVFNAIKHGGATQVHIGLSLLSDRVLSLVVTDNGMSNLKDTKIGLGTRILNDYSISWGRERIDNKTITFAEFAFSVDK